MPQKKPIDLIQRRFAGQLLIFVHDFAKIVGEIDSGTRNNIAQRKLEVPIVRCGERTLVAVPDVLLLLKEIFAELQLSRAVAIIAMPMEAPAPPRRCNGRPVKNPSATARAVLANGARRTRQKTNDLAPGRGKAFLEVDDAGA